MFQSEKSMTLIMFLVPLVWALSAVSIVVMTLPNLFGIMMLRKEMKDTMNEYWNKVKD